MRESRHELSIKIGDYLAKRVFDVVLKFIYTEFIADVLAEILLKLCGNMFDHIFAVFNFYQQKKNAFCLFFNY